MQIRMCKAFCFSTQCRAKSKSGDALIGSQLRKTWTVCHSKTRGLAEMVNRADIVVGAVGKPEFIKGSWIRDEAIVIDAGYHPGNLGDIELSTIIERCAAYTPVPGGVGPMTIATLIANTVEAAEKGM